jgi:hypothetical protein
MNLRGVYGWRGKPSKERAMQISKVVQTARKSWLKTSANTSFRHTLRVEKSGSL